MRFKSLLIIFLLAVIVPIEAFSLPDLMFRQIDKKLIQLLKLSQYESAHNQIRYVAKEVHLKNKDSFQILVHAMGPMICGTGGCPTFVFSSKLDLISWISITQLPIMVSNNKSNGWRDIIVTVSGGGIMQSYQARLRFNGKRYPSNPTVKPAEKVIQPMTGDVLIRYDDFKLAHTIKMP